MLMFALWMVLGALIGSLVGHYRCSHVSRKLARDGDTLHIVFCTGIGALSGFAVFAVLVISYYGPLKL
jgi:hypothetical protein